MVLASQGVRYMFKVAGNPFRVRYYLETIGSVYDDNRTFVQSGNDLYISGLIQEISDQTEGSDDQVLVQQGRIQYGDSKIYLAGSIDFTSGNKVFTCALSGATSTEVVYREITPGAHKPNFYGENPYKLVYVRQVPGGSLF